MGRTSRTRLLSNKLYQIQLVEVRTTRSAETANGAGDADTFNDSEGVLMAEISALADDVTEISCQYYNVE